MAKITYQPKQCTCCGQTITYLLGIDRGTVDTLKAIATAIRKKGVNMIHPRKEMELSRKELDYRTMVVEGHLTSNQVGNLSKARFHGLIASVDGKPGYYCLTTKGAQFLKGRSVPRFAVISKASGHQEGYWTGEDGREFMACVGDFKPDGPEYWEQINFEIEGGQIVSEPKKVMQTTLFTSPAVMPA